MLLSHPCLSLTLKSIKTHLEVRTWKEMYLPLLLGSQDVLTRLPRAQGHHLCALLGMLHGASRSHPGRRPEGGGPWRKGAESAGSPTLH